MPEPIAWLRVLSDGTLETKQGAQPWQKCEPSDLSEFRAALAGRCETCRWWFEDRTAGQEGRSGSCQWAIVRRPDKKYWVVRGKLITAADFGCIQWEAKE